MTEQMLQIEAYAPARFTVGQFDTMVAAFDELGFSVELDDGVIIKMNVSNYPHSRAGRLLATALTRSICSELIVDKEVSVRIGAHTVRVPDVAVFRDPGEEQGFVDPSLVVLIAEISNNSLAYDLGAKARDYALSGIADYWVFDIDTRQVHTMRDPGPDGYATTTTVPFGQPLTAACLPAPLTLEL